MCVCMYFYILMYLKFRQWHCSQPLMTHVMLMTMTHCHWLLADAQQLSRSWEICYLFRSVRPQKTQCPVLADLCPKVAELSTKKCCISVTERQKSCFRSAQRELRVFHLSGEVLRQEFSMITSEKIANSLTDQTNTNYCQLKEKSQSWRKELKNKLRYEIMNSVVGIKGIKMMQKRFPRDCKLSKIHMIMSYANVRIWHF